ncbi:uncharacterized protein LOC129776284 [Toxorhynchites rutilus septentrionalis]|uniref:uncharacterized protein LOC129776284 n=1 Tax=Toxorhynchites rutilus septentrionalis TaxID=329112 RepID=UPI00247A5771|nr:uncharacterized protein LOC129776284 [Toxorhynchites rutilus septentrionalis]XP_055637808.1 uncharacterized protein LOC129776284 [Toxorhynchites rutilus septentrionalis]
MSDNTPSQSALSLEAQAARREARRKRILENSNNRLSKIAGRELNEPPAEQTSVPPPDIIYPDPEDERDVYQQLPQMSPVDHANFTTPNGDIFSLLNTLSQAQSNGRLPGGEGQRHEEAPVPETRAAKFIRTKIHIAVTAIIVYLLFANDQQHLIGGNVFILLLGWEVIEVFLLKTYEPKASFLDVVFLLGGISKKYSQMIVKFTQTINKVLKDVAFFVFFFVLSHLVWSRLVLGIELGYVLGYERLESS